MHEEIVDAPDEEAMRAAGRELGLRLVGGSFVGLDGTLGAGKTVFVQGLALGLGIPAEVRVNSPTYAYVNEYRQGRLPLIHMDLYRIDSLDDLEAIGYRDLYESEGVCAVEWAGRIPEALPRAARRTDVRIEVGAGGAGRRLFIRTCGR